MRTEPRMSDARSSDILQKARTQVIKAGVGTTDVDGREQEPERDQTETDEHAPGHDSATPQRIAEDLRHECDCQDVGEVSGSHRDRHAHAEARALSRELLEYRMTLDTLQVHGVAPHIFLLKFAQATEP